MAYLYSMFLYSSLRALSGLTAFLVYAGVMLLVLAFITVFVVRILIFIVVVVFEFFLICLLLFSTSNNNIDMFLSARADRCSLQAVDHCRSSEAQIS